MPAITKAACRQVSESYHRGVEELASTRGIQLVEPRKGVRREPWVEPSDQALGAQDGLAVILKSRENARVAVSYATATGGNRIEVCPRCVWQSSCYLRARDCGRLFVRSCPYFPFNARLCLNGPAWLARRLQAEGIAVEQPSNAVGDSSDPARLQPLADAVAGEQSVAGAERWLAELVPVCTAAERRVHGCGHRLVVSQVEDCTNLLFDERAALDRLAARWLDRHRDSGRPDKLSTVVGRRITTRSAGALQTQIADSHLGLRPAA